MAIDLKIDLNAVPKTSRYIISAGLPLLVLLLFFFLYYKPKTAEINRLRGDIERQELELSVLRKKIAMLPQLKERYEVLIAELESLKVQLPKENEVTNLLKQISDLGVKAGLTIKLWEPGPKRVHPNGIVYEIPVLVKMKGTYHRLGRFYSMLTGLERIVNVDDIVLWEPVPAGSEAELQISFNALTFSEIPEEDLKRMAAEKQKKGRK
jgi:type IV pilus assembly protein PilO